MIDYVRDVDFNKHKSFFLEFSKENNAYATHIIRPCTATYDDVANNKETVYYLEGAVMTFTHDTSLAEIFIESALQGISIDFVDIMVEADPKDKWRNSTKCIQIIDTHKEDIRKYFDKIEAKQHYVALNTNKRDILKFLVIDRFKQDQNVDFLLGKYDKKAVVAGFVSHSEAKQFCGKMNKVELSQ